MKLKYILVLPILFLAAFFIFRGNGTFAQNNNDSYYIGRALALGGFNSDEIAPLPKINYLASGQEGERQVLFDKTKRIITLVDPKFGLGGVQAVFVAPTYNINDGGHPLACPSFKKSVGDILNDCGVILANEDTLSPSASLKPENNSIIITRVSVAQIDEFQSVPYQTKTIDDNTLERGKQVISQAGQDGKKKLTYQVRRENGLEVSRVLLNQETVSQPQDKIVKNGTKVIVLSSHQGVATIYKPSSCSVVSANYPKGTLIRITNLANGVKVFKTVDCTWGTATAADGNVLDLSPGVLSELKYNGTGAGPNVLVEQIKQ